MYEKEKKRKSKRLKNLFRVAVDEYEYNIPASVKKSS